MRKDTGLRLNANQHPLIQLGQKYTDQVVPRGKDHDGLVPLNRDSRENIEDGSLQWINRVMEFSHSSSNAQATIWRQVFPEKTPADDLDVPFLSKFEMGDGDIKNGSLVALFSTAEDEDSIGMHHLVRSLRQEFQKTDLTIELDTFDESGCFLQ